MAGDDIMIVKTVPVTRCLFIDTPPSHFRRGSSFRREIADDLRHKFKLRVDHIRLYLPVMVGLATRSSAPRVSVEELPQPSNR